MTSGWYYCSKALFYEDSTLLNHIGMYHSIPHGINLNVIAHRCTLYVIEIIPMTAYHTAKLGCSIPSFMVLISMLSFFSDCGPAPEGELLCDG